MRALGINVECLSGAEDLFSSLDMIKAAGFDCFTVIARSEESVLALKERADALGLLLPFIHEPFGNDSDMWRDGDAYREVLAGKLWAVDTAARAGVPCVVVHVSDGWNPPPVSEMGLLRYDELVNYAESRGVVIAFENVRSTSDLKALAERYSGRECVRFCFDSGHQHGFTISEDWLSVFGKRLVATHLHDNFSRDPDDFVSYPDLHLLPFDGTYDFFLMKKRLDALGYSGALMLEVGMKYSEKYLEMSSEEFLRLAFERLSRIANAL